MDCPLEFLFTLVPGIAALLIFISIRHSSSRKTSRSIPVAGGAWPIIGHLHLFGSSKFTYRTLSALADKYGSTFIIRLGSYQALVISDWEMAKECFTIHDKVFADRAQTTATKLLFYNHAVLGFAPYGTYWRQLRKIVSNEVLSNHGLEKFKHVRISEVRTAINELYKTCEDKNNGLVEMKQWLGDLTHNLAFRMVGGKRVYGNIPDAGGELRRCQELMKDVFYYLGVVVLSDAIPCLDWLDFRGHKKSMKRVAKEMDNLLAGWLKEHKQRRLLGGNSKNGLDFMDVMLDLLEDAKISQFDEDTINKASCLSLIIGADTNLVPLVWSLSLLLNNPDMLKKVQDELDFHVGRDRMVDESDIKKLLYLQAVVKETCRVYPPGPVLNPRVAREDCTLSNGYRVKAGTRLLVNVWKIQHDERVWPNPDEFQPERFLSTHQDVDIRGLHYELLPFGAGRRVCSGISLALQVVHLVLATLLHSFDVAKPSNEAIDMTESPSLSNLKATPLEVLITPRLNPKLYQVDNC